MRDLELVKLHGHGNDFLVVLGEDEGLAEAGPALARQVCDRHTGVGADGLILGSSLGQDKLSFRLWNADGSEAETSGNGLRCLGHAALDAGWVSEGNPVTVETLAGLRDLTVRRSVVPGEVWGEVGMGPVKVRHSGGHDHPDDVPCNVTQGQLLVDVGNPHLVVLGPDPAGVDVAHLGPLLEASKPDRLNVEFVALGPGPDTVTMRVWERGVGETRSCGSGACAAAAAMRHWRRVGRVVTVAQPGGTVAVELRDDGTAALAGPSVRVAECRVRVELPAGPAGA
jgi:diaminopimelate epimerase